MIEEISEYGLVMWISGATGLAPLEGWLAKSVPSAALFGVDPNPSDWLSHHDGIDVTADLPAVTSKGRTTAAGLGQFDQEDHGVTDLVERAH